MQHHYLEFRVDMHQWSRTQPVEQFLSVRGVEYFIKRVFFARFEVVVGCCEQVQVMVAEYHRCISVHCFDHSQGLE